MTFEKCRAARARRLVFESFEARRLLAAHSISMVEIQPSTIVTAHEQIPRFAASPTVVARNSGAWTAPETWNRGVVPGAGDIVSIPSGISVTYDSDSAVAIKAIEIAGDLDFATNRDTSFWISEITVLPSGSLTIGTASRPLFDSVTSEIVFTDTALDVGTVEALGSDPEQFGNGLIILGKFESNARNVTAFVRATHDISRGETELTLESVPTDWRIGDTLLLPGTNQEVISKTYSRHSETEEVQIAAISGNTITLAQPTSFFHLGIADNPFDVSVFAHVANTTRSIELRSENAAGIRGHVIATAGADVEIADTSFRSLGRTSAEFQVDSLIRNESGEVIHVGTNQVGRYGIHFHHLGHAPSVVGSVVTDVEKWGIAVHDTDHATILDNVVYNVDGAGIVTEAGNEVGNEFRGNLVAQIHGGHQINDKRAGVTTPTDVVDEVFVELGADGSAFWLRASAGTFEDNVVYDAAGYAYNFNGYYNGFRSPDFSIKQLDSFSDNEAVSSRGGLWITWSQGMGPLEDYQTQIFENFLAWNMREDAIEAYHDAEYVLRNITLVNDPVLSNLNIGSSFQFQARINQGINLGNPSYQNFNVRLEDIDISGFNVAITAPVHTGERGAIVDGARLQAYVNVAFEADALLENTVLNNITYLPTFVTRVSDAMPSQVADIWKEDIGILQMGAQALGAPPIKGPGPQLPGDIALTEEGQLKITGGATNDTVSVTISGDDLTIISNSTSTVVSSALVLSILFHGNEGDDTFFNLTSLPLNAIGGSGSDRIHGGSGDDSLHGDDGEDELYGGSGNDVIYGGKGNDVLDGQFGADKLRGGEGDDRLIGGEGSDPVLVGGIGNDHISGGDGDDVLVGGDGDDRLLGGPENDSLRGDAGEDNLQGGDGDDLLDGGRGRDVIDGGLGNNKLRAERDDVIIPRAGVAIASDVELPEPTAPEPTASELGEPGSTAPRDFVPETIQTAAIESGIQVIRQDSKTDAEIEASSPETSHPMLDHFPSDSIIFSAPCQAIINTRPDSAIQPSEQEPNTSNLLEVLETESSHSEINLQDHMSVAIRHEATSVQAVPFDDKTNPRDEMVSSQVLATPAGRRRFRASSIDA